MSTPRILIAGIGNIFLGDDAFGVEVAQRLQRRSWPDEVRVADFGIRGVDLTYALLDGYEAVVLVDATRRGGEPGTLYLIEPEPQQPQESVPTGVLLDGHGMDPEKVLRVASAWGGRINRVLLVGCEPGNVDDEDVDISGGLSDPVRATADEAVTLIESLVPKLLAGERREPIADRADPRQTKA